MELVTAYHLSEVLQISQQAVRKRLSQVPREEDTRGLVVWRRDALPQDWQQRVDLACRIKGCESIDELLSCRKHSAKHFEFSIEQATDHEKKLWPHRKEALLEYYRAIECGNTKCVAELRARETFERLTHMPVSARNIRRWIKPVEKCGGPQHAPDEAYVLWGKRRTIDGPPRETIEYFGTLVTQNQRKFSSAWRKLVNQLRAWRETGRNEYRIPGYNEPPPNAPGSDLPLRWSYRYFINRKRRPSAGVIAGARYGSTALREHTAIVHTTRVGVKPGEIISFDDQEYDIKVNVLGINTRATRPLGLDAHDHASDCTFSSFFKPTVFDDEKGAREMLKSRDMIWLAVHTLTIYGFRTDEKGTTWYLEHGTAALPAWFEQNLKIVTSGHVRIRRGGIGGKAAFDGAFDGQGKGNPRFKHLLESSRNRLRNDMADMSIAPGATGMDRDHAPEDLYGREKYNNLVLKVAAGMSPAIREQFILPFMEWPHFCQWAAACIEAINRDPEHNCEGWLASGYTANEFRLDNDAPWRPMRELLSIADPQKRAATLAFLESMPGLTRTRKLTRREVWESGVSELTRLPEWAIPQLLTHQDAPEFGVIRRVNEKGQFCFQDQQADPYGEEFIFHARVIDRSGHEVRLIEREKYKTFLNPLDPSKLIVCHLNGAYIGTCQAVERASANDMAAIGKLLATQRSLVEEKKTDLARLGAERTRELARMRMHNEGVVTPAKTERAKQIEEATDAVAKLYVNA